MQIFYHPKCVCLGQFLHAHNLHHHKYHPIFLHALMCLFVTMPSANLSIHLTMDLTNLFVTIRCDINNVSKSPLLAVFNLGFHISISNNNPSKASLNLIRFYFHDIMLYLEYAIICSYVYRKIFFGRIITFEYSNL